MVEKKRDILILVLLVCLAYAGFLGKPYHIDEPFFLAIGKHILQDPWHPLQFTFNWYGQAVPMAQINNSPPILGYLLALGLKVSGGREGWMRLLFLPFDLAAAGALYGLAARYLRRPLWPTLIAIATPAYFINMNHLMAEKIMAAFVFWGFYALVRALDREGRSTGDNRDVWFWASAVFWGLALLSKYAAGFLLLAAIAYSLARKVSLGRVGLYAFLAFSGVALYLSADLLLRGASPFSAAGQVAAQATHLAVWGWSHKSRSLLAFIGGGAAVPLVWPYFALRPKFRALAALACCLGALFLPGLDLGPVSFLDRLTGIVFACGAVWTAWVLFRAVGKISGGPLWCAWILAVVILLISYWSITSRLVLFLVPPVVFGLAEIFESQWADSKISRLYAYSLAALIFLTGALAYVDCRYAEAQKSLAKQIADLYGASERRLWCASHWGLQYYLEQIGARELDAASGGWDGVKKSDVVVLSQANTNVLKPHRRMLVNVRKMTVECAVPLRLISGGISDAGFYSNVMGFLPYAFSRETLDEFTIVEIL